VSLAPKQNTFDVMTGKAYYEGKDVFNKIDFRYERGSELSNKPKTQKAKRTVALDIEASSSKRLTTLWTPT
jgi:hypothetical protein